MLPESLFDIIISKRQVVSHLQPIISLRDKRVIGVEALSRGVDPDTGEIISPFQLFETARRLGRGHELDLVCLEAALSVPSIASDHIVFLNLDVSAFTEGNGNMLQLQEMVESRGLDPAMIAVEFVESRVDSTEMLIAIIERFREAGFLIALDDFGADHSNLERIFHAKPDIIKLDRKLVDGVSSDFYKQSIMRSVAGLANSIGTLALAEGVERLEDVITCHEIGMNLFQGYYFARPMEGLGAAIAHGSAAVRRISPVLYRHFELSFADHLLLQQGFNRIIDQFKRELHDCEHASFNILLHNWLQRFPQMDCAYIINSDGRQVSNTVCRADLSRPRHHLFSPAAAGTDHSLKTYFYSLKNLGQERYYTDPYISLATGTICRTIATKFRCGNGDYVLCVDFSE